MIIFYMLLLTILSLTILSLLLHYFDNITSNNIINDIIAKYELI